MPIEVQEVHGASELVKWFGYFPGFHDAEVVSLHLNRTGESILRVHTWEMTREVDAKGSFVQQKHVVVRIRSRKHNRSRLERFQSAECDFWINPQ